MQSYIHHRVHLETKVAWYMLGMPARQYSPFFDDFFKSRTRAQPTTPLGLRNNLVGLNIDHAVLRSENQSATHVTPLISARAKGYFLEELQVVGARPPTPKTRDVKREARRIYQELCLLIARANQPAKEVDFQIADQVSANSKYAKKVKITFSANDIQVFSVRPHQVDFLYRVKFSSKIGDVVLVPIVEDCPKSIASVKAGAVIADYFW